MVGTLLANDFAGKPLEDDGAVFSHGRGFFEDMKGFMIRAAIAHLKDLQSKPLPKRRLMDELVLGTDFTTDQYCIKEGLDLLNTWVREPDPSAPRFNLSLERLQKHGKNGRETGYPLDSWTNEQNCNYHLRPIQKWGIPYPVVLERLKLAGVWCYALCFGELKPQYCQEIVAFLDKVMPFFEEQFEPATYEVSDAKAFKRVFELCPQNGSVVLH